MRYCSNCGAEQKEGNHFCPVCGAKIGPLKNAVPFQNKPASDPSLTKNIVLISISVLLIIAATVMAKGAPSTNGGDPSAPVWGCLFYLSSSGVLSFFAVRSSTDHLDTPKMALLKTIESLGISTVGFASLFFVPSSIQICFYLVFVIFFSLIPILKIKTINATNRTSTEKVLLALSIVLFALAALLETMFLLGLLLTTFASKTTTQYFK